MPPPRSTDSRREPRRHAHDRNHHRPAAADWPLAAAPHDGTAIRATHWRKGEFVVRFDAQASRLAKANIWRGHGGSYDESDFDGWRAEAAD